MHRGQQITSSVSEMPAPSALQGFDQTRPVIFSGSHRCEMFLGFLPPVYGHSHGLEMKGLFPGFNSQVFVEAPLGSVLIIGIGDSSKSAGAAVADTTLRHLFSLPVDDRAERPRVYWLEPRFNFLMTLLKLIQ